MKVSGLWKLKKQILNPKTSVERRTKLMIRIIEKVEALRLRFYGLHTRRLALRRRNLERYLEVELPEFLIK